MKIGELARHSGLSTHTIRYYEKIGLLPYASRDRSSQRDYDASILSWIAFLRRLKTTGMPIRDMLRYAALREGGRGTEAERRALLESHRDRVRAQVSDLQACLLALDGKIAGYAAPQERIQERTQESTQERTHQTPHERIDDDDVTSPGRRREPARARPARAR
ncbi:MerR family transcriptional regulator [Methylobacterium currus]|jgi:DNA-binding transcriptional MerR regulator|uniref:MerR family transcriptional regulator n=1 Tax=Methylobacterium currus TaxID=2051553 RepID=A0A2R4WGS2_9HYPH|nr:MerR family transcriptional regulator [Methylobacterium currus]AWB20728.1 MerR family transcriptional regulator [Methylobacterium currus]